MANNLRITVTTNKNTLVAFAKQNFAPTSWLLRKLSNLFGDFSLGAYTSNTVITPNLVAATGTVTLASMVNTDTVTINGTVFTCVTSGATGNQFNVGGTDTITATNLAAAINASVTTTVAGCVSAKSAAAIVTVTCIVPGNIGNTQTLAISAHGSVSAARLAGGTEGITATFAHGQ